MNNEKTREEFKAWFKSFVDIDVLFDDNGQAFAIDPPITYGDRIVNTTIDGAWKAWQASRAALCVELPNVGYQDQEEYLKMADVFHGGERQSDMAGVGKMIDSNGEFIIQALENNYCESMMQGERNEYRDMVAKYIAHAVTSHDDLVAENEQLRKSLL